MESPPQTESQIQTSLWTVCLRLQGGLTEASQCMPTEFSGSFPWEFTIKESSWVPLTFLKGVSLKALCYKLL